MSKKSVGFGVVAAALFVGTSGLGVSVANAAEPEAVCSFWESGDVYNVLATKTGEREFRITISDLKSLASEHTSEDRFVPLPLDPNLRMSTNVVTVNPELLISNVAISQSVATGPSSDAPFVAIESFNGLAPAPWESVSVVGNEIHWVQDMDARSDENGVQVLPSDYFFPSFATDDSAGVLDFTVTVPDDVEGDIFLFEDMSVNFTSSKIEVGTGIWSPDEPVAQVVPGCQISIEAVPVTDPEGETGGPEGEPEEPTIAPEEGTDNSNEVTKEPITSPAATNMPQLAETGGSSFAPWAAGAGIATVLGVLLLALTRRKPRAS